MRLASAFFHAAFQAWLKSLLEPAQGFAARVAAVSAVGAVSVVGTVAVSVAVSAVGTGTVPVTATVQLVSWSLTA